MKSRSKHHPCFCTFVPPHVLEKLSQASEAVVDEKTREAARTTLAQDQGMRAKRAIATANMPTPGEVIEGVMVPPKGTAAREVYSCHFQESEPPPFELMRGEGDPISRDDAVNAAYNYGGAVRDYYKNKLGRNSIDNLGMNQVHNVHFGMQYVNAFWDGNEMTYGDGDDAVFTNFTSDPDVVAHELTHGVIQHTSNLRYMGQSGALNEHFADVFGSVIQQAIDGKTAHDADWLLGDRIMGPILTGEALRSMKAPGTAYDNNVIGRDPQPDHMSRYHFTHWDNEGVHINSGIPNKVFYLVAMDIGSDEAALIWYDTLQKIPSEAHFSDFAIILTDSARLLTNNGLVPVGTSQTVRLALREVGLYA
ncbi:MAG TPA: M4 family metallopeptidase [Anaerolineales bacterium]|nr:M4 family metallopeptidase [Anaerolineales bacterium]